MIKKLLRSKRFLLAVLAIVLVSSSVMTSTYMTGTYAWFITTGDPDAIDAKAYVRAANISEIEFSLNAEAMISPITLYSPDGTFTGKPEITPMPPIPGFNSAEHPYIFYPGDGIEIAIAADDLVFDITHDRNIVVEVDLSGYVDAFDGLVAEFKALSSVSGTDVHYVKPAVDGNGKYYFYVSGEQTSVKDVSDAIKAYIAGLSMEFGIIGGNVPQNGLMGAAIDFDFSAIQVGIKAVQATREAVKDVFGKDLNDIMYPDSSEIKNALAVAPQLLDDTKVALALDPSKFPSDWSRFMYGSLQVFLPELELFTNVYNNNLYINGYVVIAEKTYSTAKDITDRLWNIQNIYNLFISSIK